MLTFITSNPYKVAEVERILRRPIMTESLCLPEIQEAEVEPVARQKALAAYARLGRAVLVEDTGLALAGWNGLPGALIKWFLAALGPDGICRALAAEANRAATATTVCAYHDGAGLRLFTAQVEGIIPRAPRGSGGFGWDSIFQPAGGARTFAEMEPEEKDTYSMRRLALEKLHRSGLVG